MKQNGFITLVDSIVDNRNIKCLTGLTGAKDERSTHRGVISSQRGCTAHKRGIIYGDGLGRTCAQ